MSQSDQFKASGSAWMRGCLAVQLCVLLAVAGPAAAQEDLFALPLVAPCTQAESRAEVVPALITAGWSQVNLDSDRGRDIIRAAWQGLEAQGLWADAFTGVADVEAFVAEAGDRLLSYVEGFPEQFATFERDGMVLLLEHTLEDYLPDLTCFFAAQELPLAKQLLAESPGFEGRAFRLRSGRAERFGRDHDLMTVIELSAPEAALPLLTGRYSIVVLHFYAADQLPD